MAVIDCVSFNGENEIWDLRYNILKGCIDEFIVCEAPTTFSGNKKPFYFERIKDKYKKVSYFKIDENYTLEEIALAESSPNTHGADHWKREFLQKESILKALTHLQDNDVAIIGDVDEIPFPEYIENLRFFKGRYPQHKLKFQVYTYYLNNRSSEEFWGTLAGSWKDIKGRCLNHLRTNSPKMDSYCGWHFTSMGGEKEVRRKLFDSYTEESYNTPWIQEHLAENIQKRKDFLGRDFTYWKDESKWPEYLKEHWEKYQHLLLT
mgnify:FL=1